MTAVVSSFSCYNPAPGIFQCCARLFLNFYVKFYLCFKAECDTCIIFISSELIGNWEKVVFEVALES